MRSIARVGLTLTILLAVPAAHVSVPAAAPSRTMAVTIDDLPYVHHAATGYLAAAQSDTTKILDALKTHDARAVGFVNESKLEAPSAEARQALIALLKQWLAAGHALGNHTYSHADIDELSVDAFVDEIDKGERVTRGLLPVSTPGAGPLRWFRHPMTHTGATPEKKDGVAKALAARGYRIAPHTIENADFIFDLAYARADAETRAKLRDAYIEHTLAATSFAEEKAAELFGRDDVPQVLLIHTNLINGDALGTLLDRFQARGYRFITLDAATADRAYATPDVYVGRWGPTWLFRWSRTLAPASNFKRDPEPPEWVMTLAYPPKRG
jgi:peptidoglycan/xylan/chitin deacetylase (PgdA/CDA1 family)